MSRTDHNLVKLAAKAAGITLVGWNATYACYETDAGLWNPWLNDGDALRLAVNLRIDVLCSITGEPDPYAATRRAIVSCAAGIAINNAGVLPVTKGD